MSESELQFSDIDFAADPLPDLHDVLAQLRAKEPVSRIQFAGRPIWLLNDYETINRFIHSDEVLSAPDAYDELFATTMGKGLPILRGRERDRRGSAADDPKAYDDPRSFRIDRKQSHFAFGHGEHFCLGTQMARRVVEKGLEVLSNRFPDMALCPDTSVEILGGVLRGPRALWVTL